MEFVAAMKRAVHQFLNHLMPDMHLVLDEGLLRAVHDSHTRLLLLLCPPHQHPLRCRLQTVITTPVVTLPQVTHLC